MGLMDIYNRLPVFAQNLAFSAAGVKIQRTRFGTGFEEKLAEFESHEGWSRDQLYAWRDDHLRKLVDHAYRTVPYYRDVMDEGGIDPASIKHADDLAKLPLLTKDMIKANPKAFVSSEAGKMHLLHAHTSGTTGSGFQFESTIECQQAQFACFWRYYRKHGLNRNMWQAQFSSRQAVPQHVNKPPFWRIDKPGKRYYMSAFHESPANLHEYYDIILKNRFEWISGYPSLMVLLAQWMNERNLSFDFVKAVTCGAENLLEYQSDAMEHAFGVRPVQTYGQTENVAIFSQQPDGRILVDEDFSAVEFLPEEKSGGVPRCWHLLVQLRNTVYQICHEGRCHSWGHQRCASRGVFHRWTPRGLSSSARRNTCRQAGSCVQRYSPFSRGANLSGAGLCGYASCCGRAISMCRG